MTARGAHPGLAGAWTMVRLILRRDRVRLPVWVVSILAVVYASAQAVASVYATPAALASYARTVGSSPASIAMSGPPTALKTTGGVTVFEVNTTVVVAVSLMALFVVVRHTRAEEEAGRTELLRAAVLGRHAPLAAALLVGGGAVVLLGAGVAVTFVALGLPAPGSLVYGASVAALGLVFAAVGAVAAQLTQHARGALAVGGAVLGAAFTLRAAGDVGDQALSWLSPIGWSQAVRAFDDDAWWPLSLSLTLAALLVFGAVVLVERRDVGAGLVPPRPGPAEGARWLASPWALAVRMQRASVLGWSVGLFLGGLAFGSLGREMTDLVGANPELRAAFAASGVDLVDAFFGTAMLVLALVAAGFTIGSVLRLRGEETAGRAEPVLTTGVTRRRWMLHGLLVTLLGSVVVLAAGGLGAGLAHSLAVEDPAQLPRLLGATLAYLPATLLLGALAAAVFGWAPRAVALVWAVLAGCFVVGWLGAILRFPDWASGLSPYSHVPMVPAEPMEWLPLLALSASTVALVTLGVAKFDNRDIA